MPQDELYRDVILDHYEQPYHRGSCPLATHGYEDANPLCGDRIRIEIRVSPTECADCIFFDGQGCCISQAAASMLVSQMEGKKLTELRNFSAGDMLELFGATLTPARKRCCLLPWRVLQRAIAHPLDKPQ